MNVRELIKELEQVSPSIPIVFPDTENGYRNVNTVAITSMSIFNNSTFTYDKVDKGYIGQDKLPTTLVAIIRE